MLVGSPLNLFEMLGECKKLNQTLPAFVVSAPDGTEAADFLSSLPILRLQRLVKSKHFVYIGGAFQSKVLR